MKPGVMSLMRTVCIINITLIEETMTEQTFRSLHFLVTYITAFATCSVNMFSGDVLTGTGANLLTRQSIPPGMYFIFNKHT